MRHPATLRDGVFGEVGGGGQGRVLGIVDFQGKPIGKTSTDCPAAAGIHFATHEHFPICRPP
jgi:hypothetical protein